MLKVMLRRRRQLLPRSNCNLLDDLARCLRSATPFTKSLSINAAAWLFWAMSWRGVSSVP